MTSPLPAKRRSRGKDRRTSIEAAKKAISASQRAIDEIEALMGDGVPRIDEEIHQEVRAGGYFVTLDTIQHGRLALSEVGILADTGLTKDTSRGSASCIWVIDRQRQQQLNADPTLPATSSALRMLKPSPAALEEAYPWFEAMVKYYTDYYAQQGYSLPESVGEVLRWLEKLKEDD